MLTFCQLNFALVLWCHHLQGGPFPVMYSKDEMEVNCN
ncbi:hypothetical protein GLYMA_11G027851v4 [Glycine max]|nr:hypothetical protein GLYMA_11G027851v4 [Glycine max]KAH1157272.1 hypothetical protein GYH30_029849 [Glycine max]